MRAIWREAAVTRAPRFSRQKCASRFTTAAPPIARKRYSYKGFGRSGDLRKTIESSTGSAAFQPVDDHRQQQDRAADHILVEGIDIFQVHRVFDDRQYQHTRDHMANHAHATGQ